MEHKGVSIVIYIDSNELTNRRWVWISRMEAGRPAKTVLSVKRECNFADDDVELVQTVLDCEVELYLKRYLQSGATIF